MAGELRLITAHDRIRVTVTFAQLRALVAVARTGSVTRAAADLLNTQPAVSHSIRKLEQELGAELLARRANGVSLTAAGRIVARRAAAILAQIEGMRQEVAATAGKNVGTLRIGAFPSATGPLLAPVFHAFGLAYSGVRLTVLEGSDEEVLYWLRTSAVDVATVTRSEGDVRTFPLTADEMVAVLPERHPLAQKTAISVAELAGDPFIMSTGGCEPLIVDIARRAGVALRRHYEVRDTTSIVTMVREGLGVSIMPRLAISADTAGVALVAFDPPEGRELLLAVLADADALPSALTFIELAQELVSGAPATKTPEVPSALGSSTGS